MTFSRQVNPYELETLRVHEGKAPRQTELVASKRKALRCDKLLFNHFPVRTAP